MTSGPRITIPLPRVPGALVGILIALLVVGGFMALDRTVGHWYVPDPEVVSRQVDSQLRRVGAQGRDLRELQSRVEELESSRGDADGLALYETDLERDAAISRLGFAVTVNSLVNNLGGFQTNTSPRGKACQAWLLDGTGSISDCGFTPTN